MYYKTVNCQAPHLTYCWLNYTGLSQTSSVCLTHYDQHLVPEWKKEDQLCTR